jgi:Flp pilus assembly pilin Flp
MVSDLVLRVFIATQSASTRTRDEDSRGEDGQTLAEYSLIMSTIAVAVVIISVIAFRGALVNAWNDAANCLSALAPC